MNKSMRFGYLYVYFMADLVHDYYDDLLSSRDDRPRLTPAEMETEKRVWNALKRSCDNLTKEEMEEMSRVGRQEWEEEFRLMLN